MHGTLPEGSIYEHSKVIDMEKVGEKYKTICENGSFVESSYVVIASHYPIINFPGFYFLKMYQSMSYVIAVDTKCNLPNGMYINSEIPTYSFRTTPYEDKKLLLNYKR